MLIFCACLLAMFLFWLLGNILDTFLYLGILFVDHLISYWYFYLPLIILISLAIAFGIKSVLAMLVLIILILSLVLALMIYWPRHHNS
ncbi:hypothetical protein [Leuconostoc mesenteroides]|uniref:hypothetical protein n=1 Tax=Leuconostoc mesenteroides TaxID=1245 RepID=UPI0005658E44|nr:hypothetical protein [Leuconostoc mesenteroides]OQJ71348.1 hypothetical protein BMS79_04715 [Leuconostoc pseudomesenteroides]OQJ80010.1 hypothetical protein BMS81_04580 [Leuconostoc pseudomesenteroides]ORI85914.1 hypothetical protein BMS95_08770 [Leuconostoc pseudomesenteroides]QHM58081.1 hypothetical protein C7M45_00786 [Leuconostoc mesenteroides]SPE13798.1 hypothetical protein LEM9268_00896 [Leuconostoc mesenteroides]